MYWSWEVAFDVLPQLAKGVVVTIQATIVASILAYVFGTWNSYFKNVQK